IKASVTALIGSGAWDSRGLSSEERHELLQIIDEESDRLNRFIEGLSAADRPDPSQPLGFPPVRLEDIVRAGLTRAATVTRDHLISVELGKDIPSVSVDPAAIAEVIYILLDNASKYSPPGSSLRVTGSRDGHHARIEVTDSGPGIAPEHREQVFE